jgi:type IV pilus assembly protein PilP
MLIILLFLLSSQVSGEEKRETRTDTIKPVAYRSGGRRDPFLSLLEIRKGTGKKKKRYNPLEKYDVADFRLIGIVYDGSDYYASVVLPDGKGYTIREGMTVGLNEGKVVFIRDGLLGIKEYIVDYMGRRRVKETLLRLGGSNRK